MKPPEEVTEAETDNGTNDSHPYLGAWKLLASPPGTCEQCAVAHDPGQPREDQREESLRHGER